jgi:hypothetical protein
MRKLIALFFLCGVALADTATVSWELPTQNDDHTPIPAAGPNSLLGTTVEYGSCSAPGVFGTKQGEKFVAAPATTTQIDLAEPQTYCLRASVKNASGAVSGFSNVATKVVAAEAGERSDTH